jgi:peroxiredoxin
MYARYQSKGFEVVSVNMSWDKEAGGRKFVEEYKLPFTVGRDGDEKIKNLYKVEATPSTFFIDKAGILRRRVDGEMAEADIEREIEKLLTS